MVSEIDYSGNLESVLTRWIEAGAAGFILDEFSVDFPSHADKLRDWSNLIGNSTNINDQSEILLALSTPAFTTLPDNFCRYATEDERWNEPTLHLFLFINIYMYRYR